MFENLSKKIVLTGGGTAGHVIPNLALLKELKTHGFEPIYIGGKGVEKKLAIENNLEFYEVQTGKLRRYFSKENFTDLFKIIWGFFQAYFILKQLKPELVFSKGGFVAVPVCFAAKLLKIPIITHESDLTPGLATKLISPLASKILYAFPESEKYFKPNKSHLVSNPIREELFEGDFKTGLTFCDFEERDQRPIVLFMGGSSGSLKINEAITKNLDELCKVFRVIHLAGPARKATSENRPGEYICFDYVSDELKDLYACADYLVGRSGASAIFEWRALKKPMLLIPLEEGSRGDQILNAESFVRQGIALVLKEKDLQRNLVSSLKALHQDASQLKETMMLVEQDPRDANRKIVEHFKFV